MLGIERLKEIFSPNTQSKDADKLMEQAWEQCMSSKCVEAKEILKGLDNTSWEKELLELCLNGMELYQSSKPNESYNTFQGVFSIYSSHKGTWSPLETFKFDWVVKQFRETAYKIDRQTYKDLLLELAPITSECVSPISLADQANGLLNEGKLAEAERKCEESLRLLELNSKIYPKGLASNCKADTINVLVATKNFLGKFDEANHLIENILKTPDLSDRLQVNFLRKRAEVAIYKSEFSKANEDLEKCFKILNKSGDLPLRFSTLLRSAISHQKSNHFEEALCDYKLMIRLKEYKLNPQEVAVLKWNIGMMLYRMQQQSIETNTPLITSILELLKSPDHHLESAYELFKMDLPGILLAPTLLKATNSSVEVQANELVAYIPYGFDVL